MTTFSARINQAELHLSQKDPLLAQVIKRYDPCTITPHTNHYGELVSSIVGQQLSEKAGATIWKRVLAVFDGKMPLPDQLLAEDTEVLRGCGVSYAKVSYMKDLAQHIIDGRLDMDHISTLPNDELIKQLTAVKGIGEWSAHMFMMFSLGRLDILPTGDLGIRKGMMRLYDLPELPKPAQMREIASANHWSPYESVASWYIWQSLDNA